ncbi:hypothetical protein FRACYDRAFT_188128 [Fragilariopsis cylindrus CCMP1102]|uniref:Phosphodiesterase n=1 Tax=Fragilariopsis cylindrus CCMP1102 TaxID=635003 RepID=A0A1E7F9R8_9STRA|nr:hypothetical protein FRACYDRAFT_188128 [Fragilariopsis cylindrus CCMP1102]|eukprot:OEU14879.1 hypothetical protein FRACYDRAFT_188128 [Fragilariopsis cylindrus CCMP1102]
MLFSRYGNTEPIADFYPNTTIMMCDLAGFTAWSSQRSPSDVFRLLETIYGAFDDIARAENVFKVETVGDCYVACAGLPQKQPKHAVIMARFAKKCLRRYETLIKKLEKYLGPDTTDLGIRVGLHSGGVTAGVLRGDKTRYQLFGDTVNTASRMESTGQVNKIQVSSETAKLLIDAGHGKSVIEREHLVTVKGKGEMQTYWIRSSSSKLEACTATNSLHTSSYGMNSSTNSIDTTLSVDSSIMRPPTKRMQSWTASDTARNPKEHRLIEWIVETLMKSLKKIAVDRRRTGTISNNTFPLADFDSDGPIIEEIKEVISIRQGVAPSLCASAVANAESSSEGNHHNQLTTEVSIAVEDQLRDYVTVISLLYHDNAFHNFEHAAHVLMSVSKLISRMLENKMNLDESINDDGMAIYKEEEEKEDNAYGATFDPMTEFACLFSALIHDVDHNGVPNSILIKEDTAKADQYRSKSVAEQHSIALAWSLLMEPCYEDLRKCIYQTEQERTRFRQVVVNSVMATDIVDAILKKSRDDRWEKAINMKNDDIFWGKSIENSNRMATIAIDHIIQASDTSHTMQHWQIFLKFNERLYREMHQAYKDGRAERDPSEFWYKGELDFFDFYIIPLATKLKESGVFGVSSDEYLNYAKSNRMEWALKGQDILIGYKERVF